jgi:hypothetical protein
MAPFVLFLLLLFFVLLPLLLLLLGVLLAVTLLLALAVGRRLFLHLRNCIRGTKGDQYKKGYCKDKEAVQIYLFRNMCFTVASVRHEICVS